MDIDAEHAPVPLPLRGDRHPDLRAPALKRWLDSLPIANLGLTSGSLFEALQLANREPLSAAERLRFLETLRPTYVYALMRLRKLYGFREFPPSPRDEQVRAFVLAMLDELASGYGKALADLPADGRHTRKQAALALQRSIRCLSGRLIEHLRFYEPAPAGLWRDLHALYRDALARGIAHMSVVDDGLCGRGRCSIRRAYKQILLLAAMGPQQLRHQELDGLFAALKAVAAATDLRTPAAGPLPAHTLVIRLRLDQGPTRLAIPAAESLWLDCRRFGLQGMRRAGRPWRRSRASRPGAASSPLVERIRRALARPLQTRLPRSVGTGRMPVVVGLHRISQWLNEPRTEPVAQALRRMHVQDISDRGYALLLLQDDTPLAIRVGDALALHPAENAPTRAPHSWRIGLVKWLQCEPDGLRLGVEMLPGRPTGVTVQPRAARPEDKPTGALVLTDARGGREHITLLAPQLNLLPGTELRIEAGTTDFEVRLTQELASTGACQRFDFDWIEAKREADPGFRELYASL